MTAANPGTVAQYLDALREALQGADPALVQDALYDAEEHLRAELSQHPDEPESTVLERIVGSYGAPDEVADAYRANEVRVQAALRTPAPKPVQGGSIARFFGVYRDPRAYLALLYMLLSLVTGIVYFTFAATGTAMSAGLAILIVGVPFFLLFVGTSRVIALAEGRIVESMLGTRMPRRPVYPGQTGNWFERIMNMLKDPRTWGTLLYLFLMMPLGILYFTFAVTGVIVSLALFIAPIAVLLHFGGIITIDGEIQSPHPAMLPLISILGIVLLTITMHLARGIGYLHGQLAKSLLVRAPRTED
jgi:uncharacterized membrane protein